MIIYCMTQYLHFRYKIIVFLLFKKSEMFILFSCSYLWVLGIQLKRNEAIYFSFLMLICNMNQYWRMQMCCDFRYFIIKFLFW